MRSSTAIVKEIKSKKFPNMESEEFKTLSLELHKTLTWERNTKQVNVVVEEEPKAVESKATKTK
tara:strand:- start:625 stop:816 length:192 start_codon:yes stop_codon:yes gene_type:complete